MNKKELIELKKIIEKHFTRSDWIELGFILDADDIIGNHPRLLRSLDFGDEDYGGNILEVLTKIVKKDSNGINKIKQYLLENYAISFKKENKSKENGDIIEFIKKKDYVMVNKNLGCGSFGKTVLLLDSAIDELFVAKKYEPENTVDKREFYNSFVQEIKIMHKLFHKNLVRIFNYYLYPDIYTGYILMEYIDGKSIDKYISEDNEMFNSGALNKIFIQLLEAFNFLEQNGILHRDIRESNILIDRDGVVKIIDFGLGKITNFINKSTDSKDGIINRYNMARHPNEFKDGRYTHKTEMFCIAELFERILIENKITKMEFKYFNILGKMTKPDEKDRYESFQKIIDSMNQKEFELMKINDTDKIIYQEFSNTILSKLVYYKGEKIFRKNIDGIIRELNLVVKENILEDFIQRNEKLISVFVNSAYIYRDKIDIPYKTVTDFYNWFINISEEYQKLVVNNLVVKLSKVKLEPDIDIPF